LRATRTVFFLVESVLELHVCVVLSLAHFSLVLCVACYFSVHKPALAHELTASLLGVPFFSLCLLLTWRIFCLLVCFWQVFFSMRGARECFKMDTENSKASSKRMAFPRNDGPAPQCLLHLLSPLYPPSTRAAAHNTAVDMTCQLCYNGVFPIWPPSKTNVAQVNKCKFI